MRTSLLTATIATLASLTACGGDGGGGDDGPTFADDHPRVYIAANRTRLEAALAAPRPAATRFKRIVDLELGGSDIYAFEGWYAALMGQLTGEPQYCAFAVAHVDEFVTAEEGRIRAGERPQVSSDSYLEIGAHIGDVMLTYDWCFDQATAAQKTRWLDFSAKAIWNVWHHEDAEWGGRPMPWSGWSVENPSNNYYYSFLRATMLFGLAAHGEHPDAEQYLAFFRDTKIGGELVPTFSADLVGGGSREGTGYGTSMHRLWELFDLWESSTGENLSRLTSHSRQSMLYLMHAVVPTRDFIAPIGDHARDSTGALFDYHRNYLQELGYLFRDDPVVPATKHFLANSSVPEMDQPFMYVYDFLYDLEVEPRAPDAMGRAYYGAGTGHLFARSSWAPDATWVNLIAGPYTESHAHHDQGSIMIYRSGWLAYDAQIASTSGIRPEEELHNLVRISNGATTIRQREGTTSRMVGLARGDGWLHAAADLTPAYNGNTAIQKVERELVFIEPDVIVVFDRVATGAGTTQTWQLSSPTSPVISGATATAGALHVQRIAPATASSSVFSWRTDGDFSGGFRLDTALTGGNNQLLHVLSVGRTVGTTRSDDGGRIGVAIDLGGGRTATVRFDPAAVGGTLDVRGGAGPVVTETLGAGVAALPE